MLKIGDLLGAKERVKLSTRPPDAAAEPEVLVADTARLAATGWKPQFDLDDGLSDTIAWWRQQVKT
jgi:nucleoside-diphosphate-sugar epimerase